MGSWQVHPSLNRIADDQRSIRITPKAMDVLCCLASHGNEVVSRDELMESVWPDVVVNEDVLTRAISDLRKVLAKESGGADLIETVPKRGYRLAGPVEYDVSGDSAPQAAATIDVRLEKRHVESATGVRPMRLGISLAAVLIFLVLAWRMYPAPEIVGPAWRYSPSIPVTTLPGAEMQPALSPDGRQVAFSWAGSDDADYDIYVALVGEGVPLRLTEEPGFDHSPTWHPDGGQLAYMSRDDEGCNIYLVSALGGPRRKVTSCGENLSGDLEWSPDGNWLTFADRPAQGASFGVVLYSMLTGERIQLTAPDNQHWGDSSPAFSPDGNQIAFQRSVSMATQDLYIVGASEGEPVRLTNQSSAFRGHTWTRDGKGVIASSGLNGNMNLWIFPLDGGQPEWIPEAGENAFRPHAAGPMLVFEQRRESTDIMVSDVEGPTARSWSTSTRKELHPVVSPSGDLVAFVSDRSGHTELWVAAQDGSDALQLTFFNDSFVGSPAWSPDGTRLAFDARPEGHADVFVVDAQGGTPSRITYETSNDLNAAWSPDGQTLYFGSNRSGTWQIWNVPFEGGDARPVTTDGGYTPQVDDSGVYFTRYDQPGIWKKSGGAPATSILGVEGPTSHDSWMLSGNRLYYVSGDSIVRFDMVSGLSMRIPAPDVLQNAGLSVMPDGRVFYTISTSEGADLMGLKRQEAFIR